MPVRIGPVAPIYMSGERQNDRREVMFRNVRSSAAEQSTPEYRENYFRSCEAHGGELAEVVAIVRKEYETNH